jgi:hypothetical protein
VFFSEEIGVDHLFFLSATSQAQPSIPLSIMEGAKKFEQSHHIGPMVQGVLSDVGTFFRRKCH